MAKKKRRSQTPLLIVIILCLVAVAACALLDKTPSQPATSSVNATETTNQTDETNRSEQRQTDVTGKTTDKTVTTDHSSTTSSATASKTDVSSKTTNTTSDKTSNRTPYVSTNDTTSFDKDLWYMKLVNPDHGIDQDFIDSVEMSTVFSNKWNWKLDARCAADMKAMIDGAKADGVELIICSAFRSIELQTTNFNNYVTTIMKENPSWTREQAVEYTTHVIAVPGTSEHHTGLAADIVTPSFTRLNKGFANTDAFRWLYAHCAEYGFVLRYPEDKQDITKIIYEPWHYRYVGKEAATIMMNEGICFEEFLEKYGT